MNFANKMFKRYALKVMPQLARVKEDLAGMPLSSLPTNYYHKDPFANHQLAYLTHLVCRSPVLRADAELAPYVQSRDFFAFASHLSLLSEAVFYLYYAVYEEAGLARVFNARWETSAADVHDIRIVVEEYVRLMRETAGDAHWHAKIRDDIGKYIALLYKMHADSPRMAELYKDVDLQELLS